MLVIENHWFYTLRAHLATRQCVQKFTSKSHPDVVAIKVSYWGECTARVSFNCLELRGILVPLGGPGFMPRAQKQWVAGAAKVWAEPLREEVATSREGWTVQGCFWFKSLWASGPPVKHQGCIRKAGAGIGVIMGVACSLGFSSLPITSQVASNPQVSVF